MIRQGTAVTEDSRRGPDASLPGAINDTQQHMKTSLNTQLDDTYDDPLEDQSLSMMHMKAHENKDMGEERHLHSYGQEETIRESIGRTNRFSITQQGAGLFAEGFKESESNGIR